MAHEIGCKVQAAQTRADGSGMRRRLLPSLMAAAALGALGVLTMQGSAHAANECGPVNTASNPQTVTCTGAFNPYASGITYDETTFPAASQGNLQVNLSATAAVTTSSTGVTAVGASGKNADIEILTGASVSAGAEGAKSSTTGGGTASITNAAKGSAATIGLGAQSRGGPGPGGRKAGTRVAAPFRVLLYGFRASTILKFALGLGALRHHGVEALEVIARLHREELHQAQLLSHALVPRKG